MCFEYRDALPFPGIILGMGLANKRRRYNVTSFIIGWAHTKKDPCISVLGLERLCD